MNIHQLSEKMTAAILGLLFVACVGFQLYALNKGFDITDEGYNLQLVSSKFVGISNTYFFEVVQLLFGWMPNTLIANRIIATGLLFVSSIFFLIASFRFFCISFSATSVFFCLLSIPFAVTLDPVTLSYNNTTAVFTLLSVACYFMLHAAQNATKFQLLYAVFSGCFAAIVCVTKITSGLALSIAIPTMILLSLPHKIKYSLFFLAGWFGYHLVHASLFTPFYIQIKNIWLAADLFAQMDAKYNQLTLLQDIYLFVKLQAVFATRFILLFLLAAYIPHRVGKGIVLLFALALLGYEFYTNEFQLTGLIYVLCSVMGVSSVLASEANKHLLDTIRKNWKCILHGLLLFFLPLIVVMGTNNVYYHNYIFATIPLAVLSILALQRVDIRWFKQLTLLVVGCCVSYVCYTKIIWQPYRILPLQQQTETIDKIPMLDGIKLDAGSKFRYQSLQTTLTNHRFTSEHGLICLGKMQGLQYLLQASSPGGVMFSPTFKELYLCNLEADKNDYKHPYFVLSDYKYTDSIKVDQSNWENRFMQALGKQMKQTTNGILIDSIVFETAPLGILYLYK
jgi:hypothetical protein